jgi:hypothetical protein
VDEEQFLINKNKEKYLAAHCSEPFFPHCAHEVDEEQFLCNKNKKK